jgi:hypothetical protein
MALSNPSAADLSRYSVGEITQLVGPNIFYNAGASKWLRTGNFTAATNLGTAAKNNLAAGSTSSDINIALLSAVESSLTGAYPHAPLPAQRISASGVTVFPGCSGTTTPIVTAVTSAGAQNVSLPITSAGASSSAGSNICVASNNTTIFAYGVGAGNVMVAASTTDGLNWSSVSLTGLPTSTNIAANRAFSSGNGVDITVWGRKRAGGSRFAVFWCGARFIMLFAEAAGSYVTSTSTNGIAWSGDTTLTVLADAAVTSTYPLDFYRNGNNCYLNIYGTARYSTDGGITWANCTGMAFYSTATYYQKTNSDTPAKLIYSNNTSSLFSADSGATWTSRTLPGNGTNTTSSLAYKGSTVVLTNTSIAYRSVNDGASWTPIVFPAGTLASGGVVFSDANRFYFCPQNQPQILTSTDAITWTIVSVPANAFGVNSGGGYGGILAYDSNNVVLIGYNGQSGYDICALTTDGGVTWKTTTVTNSNSVNATFAGDAYMSPDGLGGGTTAFGGQYGGGYYGASPGNVCSKATVVAGGGFYRSGTNAVTATNANAYVYTRVE